MAEHVKKDNRGYLYPNKNKTKPTQPDHTGKVLVDNKEWRISAWENKTPEGNSYLSISFTPPLPQNPNNPQTETSHTKQEITQHQETKNNSIDDDLDLDAILGSSDDFPLN